jgi:hypothetical protein
MGQWERISALREAARNEASALVRLVAEPRRMDETVSSCIRRAAILLGWSYRRTEDIWRKEARRIDSWEMDQLRAMQRKKDKR